MQVGCRAGGGGGPAKAGLLPPPFLVSLPQECTQRGGCCRLHIRGTAEGAGLGGAGGEDSVVLCECPLFPPWALGETGTEGTGPLAGALSWGMGRVLAILIRRDGERRVRDGGRRSARWR